jgi:hypothetical protein
MVVTKFRLPRITVAVRQLAFPGTTREGKLERAFWVFHTQHPEIGRHLARFALQWRDRKGSDATLGIKALFERVRWEISIESLLDEAPPKLNNNHTAFYARWLMDNYPELDGIFSLRQQRIPATFGPENESLPDNIHSVLE